MAFVDGVRIGVDNIEFVSTAFLVTKTWLALAMHRAPSRYLFTVESGLKAATRLI